MKPNLIVMDIKYCSDSTIKKLQPHFNLFPSTARTISDLRSDLIETQSKFLQCGLGIKIGNELLDGRNRMRACEALKQEGWSGSCPVVEWKDNGRNVAGWIWDTNALRRHMEDDALAMASAAVWPLIAEENKANKKASQFNGSSSGPGRGNKTVRTDSTEPFKRDTKAEDARSTVGQVAAQAKTSIHKARQAIAVQKAIENGTIPADTAKAVMSGKKKLKDVLPSKPKAETTKKYRTMKMLLDVIRDADAEWKNADYNLEVLRDEYKTHLERI